MTTRPGLLALVWPFVAVVLAQTLMASLSIYTLSAVRGYVGGESLWSKGYKEAIHQLEHYAQAGERGSFDLFRAALQAPLADREARIALDRPDPDRETARRGFLRGGIHPADVDSLIWLFVNFRNVSHLADAIARWEAADPKIVELAELGRQIRRERQAIGSPSVAQVAGWVARIDKIDGEIAPLTVAFSQALGRGSRAITAILFGVNVAAAALLIGLAVWRTRKLVVQRRSVEQVLDAERRKAQTTLASIGQAVITVDGEGRLDYLNPAAARLLRLSAREAGHARLGALFELRGDDETDLSAGFAARLLAGQPVNLAAGSMRLVRRDGEAVPVSMVGAPLPSVGGAAGAVVVINDMTREQELIDGLSWQARHDSLTGLFNRRGFEEELAHAVDREGHGALLLIDLDQFKIVNDTCGHAAGDELLRRIGATLVAVARSESVLARLGGDEFGLLLSDGNACDVVETAEAIRAAVEDLEFHWQGRAFAVTASIGVVDLARAGRGPEEAMRAADVACYMAKEKGRNRVFVHESDDAEVRERVGEMAWVPRIRRALDEDRFVLYAQPIAALHEGAPGGHVELLVRMRDEDGGLAAPSSFIPPAERFGLMPAIDRWVVREGLRAIARRLGKHGAHPIGTCAINLSGATFADPTFPDFVREQFAATGVDPSTICFEITETSAISRLAAATEFIRTLKALGCRFSLDDFGAGMSSFAYLKTLPVDYLKIDGGFVRDMLVDRIDRAMVEMIHHIGRVTGKLTIAEFAETPAILDALRSIGVDYAQGYAIAAPTPFEDGDLAMWAADLSSVLAESTPGPLRKAG